MNIKLRNKIAKIIEESLIVADSKSMSRSELFDGESFDTMVLNHREAANKIIKEFDVRFREG